jgi:hypothetical protein
LDSQLQIGELFINLGIKGADVVGKGLDGAKKGMEGLASVAGEASLALLGVVAGLEETVRRAGAQAHDMIALSDATGIAVEQLGALKNAFRQFGAEKELAPTLDAIRKVQGEIARNKGMSGEQEQFVVAAHADPEKFKKDTVYVLELARKLVQSMPKGNAAELEKTQAYLASVGLSGNNMFSMLSRAKQDFTKLKPGDVINTDETNSLNSSYVGLSNILDKIEKFGGHKAAKFGNGFVTNLDNMTTSVLDLVDALDQVGKKYGIFEKIGNVAKAVSEFFDTTSLELRALSGDKKAQAEYLKNIASKQDRDIPNSVYSEEAFGKFIFKMINKGNDIEDHVTPAQKARHRSAGATHHASNTVININGVEGAEDATSELSRAVARTVVTIPRGQVA